MNWIYQRWWKWLCAALLVYVLIGSFFIPLGPGITKVHPSIIYADTSYVIRITGFNTHFTSHKVGKLQLWFKNKSRFYSPISLQVLDNKTLSATFGLSQFQAKDLGSSNFDVVINDDVDGTFSLRDALVLVKTTREDSSFKSGATLSIPEVNNNKHNLTCFPYREILYETIRNTFFHVPMWFVMTMLVFASFIWSILFLIKGDPKWDMYAHQSVIVALVFSACGYFTGLVWAKYTWYIGVDWLDVIMKLLLEDIKMAAALVAIIFYVAYMVIRNSFADKKKITRIAAMFNVVAFVVFIFCVFVLPRLTDSMHPGNGGNPAFSKYDLDSTLRMFFYPAVIGWILLGFWFLSILIRMQLIHQKQIK
ncbi:MAG: hypothetical protein IPP77_06580 [Bacteroidetes bacterium]|nr:hypothetical protein [Bacteroidota bacterium]